MTPLGLRFRAYRSCVNGGKQWRSWLQALRQELSVVCSALAVGNLHPRSYLPVRLHSTCGSRHITRGPPSTHWPPCGHAVLQRRTRQLQSRWSSRGGVLRRCVLRRMGCDLTEPGPAKASVRRVPTRHCAAYDFPSRTSEMKAKPHSAAHQLFDAVK